MPVISGMQQKEILPNKAELAESEINTKTTIVNKKIAGLKADKVSFSAVNKDKKISFGEGVKLVTTGFFSKIGEMFKSIVKHPIRTIGTLVLTTVTLAALPLIGVSMATGASVLAVGFAAIAVAKAGKDIYKAVKHNKNKNYDAVRQDLRNIGGDSLDLALSLPFVPKAINQIKRQIRFAPKLALNSELWNNIKETKGIGAKILELLKGNLKIEYHTQAREMGLKVYPELVFDKKSSLSEGGVYCIEDSQIKINPAFLNPINIVKKKILAKFSRRKIAVSNLSLSGFLRHELEHVKQFQEIVLTENIGIKGLAEAVKKTHAEKLLNIKASLSQLKAELQQLRESNINDAQIAQLEADIRFLNSERRLSESIIANPEEVIGSEYFKEVINSSDSIKAGSQKAKLAKEYLDGYLEKLNDEKKIEALYVKAQAGEINPGELNNEALKIYKSNILEKEAFGVQEQFIKSTLKNRPDLGMVLAQEFSVMNNPENRRCV